MFGGPERVGVELEVLSDDGLQALTTTKKHTAVMAKPIVGFLSKVPGKVTSMRQSRQEHSTRAADRDRMRASIAPELVSESAQKKRDTTRCRAHSLHRFLIDLISRG